MSSSSFLAFPLSRTSASLSPRARRGGGGGSSTSGRPRRRELGLRLGMEAVLDLGLDLAGPHWVTWLDMGLEHGEVERGWSPALKLGVLRSSTARSGTLALPSAASPSHLAAQIYMAELSALGGRCTRAHGHRWRSGGAQRAGKGDEG